MIPIVGSDYPKVVIPLIDSAKKNIDIIVYDWRWYANQSGHPVQQFNSALVRAVQRGVFIRAILNTSLIVPVLKKVGIRARTLSDRRTLHPKVLCIDDSVMIIGSHNYTRNAFGANVELSVVIDIPSSSTRFADFFNNLYES